MPRDYSKCMKAYQVLSVHPKFAVEIPTDGTRPLSKNPITLMARDRKSTEPGDIGDTESN